MSVSVLCGPVFMERSLVFWWARFYGMSVSVLCGPVFMERLLVFCVGLFLWNVA